MHTRAPALASAARPSNGWMSACGETSAMSSSECWRERGVLPSRETMRGHHPASTEKKNKATERVLEHPLGHLTH